MFGLEKRKMNYTLFFGGLISLATKSKHITLSFFSEKYKYIISYFETIVHLEQQIIHDLIVSEYDQEIPQSHTADQPTTP